MEGSGYEGIFSLASLASSVSCPVDVAARFGVGSLPPRRVVRALYSEPRHLRSPPYDAGGTSFDSSLILPSSEAGLDASIVLPDSASPDTGPEDSGPLLGTLTGLVIDYTQGNGRGVLPGAALSLSIPSGIAVPSPLPSGVTSDANGLFTITGVPAGVALQLTTTKSTDLQQGIAYSTSYVTVTVGAGETTNVFPVVHEGCYQTFVLNPAAGTDAGNQPVTLDNASCLGPLGPTSGERPGAYAAMSFDATAFKDPVTNSLWAQPIRVEMIPLAYPTFGTTSIPDLSWSVGLPGQASPPGLLGAVEYRVVKSDPGQSDDGKDLVLNNPTGDPVTIAVPVYTPPTSAGALTFDYNPATAGWMATSATPGTLQSSAGSVAFVALQASPAPAGGRS